MAVRAPKSARTDLVISMTLAEIFLLLLFVVWWGVVPHGVEPTPEHLQIVQLRSEIEDLRRQICDITSQRDTFKTKADDLERQMEWFKANYGMPPPSSPGENRKFLLAVGRGKPPCQDDNNLLASASVIDGHPTIKIITAAPGLIAAMGDWGRIHLAVGSELSDGDDIDHLLSGISRYRVSINNEQHECRFDYRLVYGTYKDYYDAREKFEKQFYSASRTAAPGYRTKE
jgi:hypothetical protein